MAYKLFWSEEALSNLEDILNYLGSNWSETEINNFKSLLIKNLELIPIFPTIFPKSEFAPNQRRAVLSKHISIFNKIIDEAIYIVYLSYNTFAKLLILRCYHLWWYEAPFIGDYLIIGKISENWNNCMPFDTNVIIFDPVVISISLTYD